MQNFEAAVSIIMDVTMSTFMVKGLHGLLVMAINNVTVQQILNQYYEQYLRYVALVT